VVYWLRQALALFAGLLFGALPVKGLLGGAG
jgi:hypothetical protein